MNNSIGIFSDNIEQNFNQINTIWRLYKKNNDVVIFTDDSSPTALHHIAIFPSFYSRFFKGTIVFLDAEDYLTHKDNIISKPMLVIEDKFPDILDRSVISADNILHIIKEAV